MSGYRLCQIRKARHPYYIESISTNIYTIEELCFYLKENIYLIDNTIMNERLCDWIKAELGLVRLYRRLYEQLEKEAGIGDFILPIFKEIDYLTNQEFQKLQAEISRIEVQPRDTRRKMKADYLVSYKMYRNAINEYYYILKERSPGNMGAQFYGTVLNNMAAAYARMFQFEDAAACLWQSYGLVRSNEVYRKYLSALYLSMNTAEYEKRLAELRVPKEQQEKIENQVLELMEKVRENPLVTECDTKDLGEIVEKLKGDYVRGSK